MDKPTLPKGTRDFGPATMAKRQFIFNTIRNIFQKYGFQPLETPSMENLSTLTGKYGEEGDQLLFKILDSGDFYKRILNPFESKSLEKVLNRLLGTVNQKWTPNEDLKSLISNVLADLHKEDLHSTEDDLKNFERIKSYITVDAGSFYERISHWLNKPVENENPLSTRAKAIDNIVDQLTSKINGYATQQPIPRSAKEILSHISEKGLRYDLTVPFARYVVMNRHEISFPFKRYQIQPVWRADRPQKGRYREFYQCDADVVGTDSLICEAEIILMIKEVFKGLGIQDYTIKINHRGILNGIAEVIGALGNETPMFVAIDKLDKIGEEKVKEELRGKNFSEQGLTSLFNILNVKGTNINKLGFLSGKFETTQAGQKGLRDLKEVFDLLKNYGTDDSHVEFDVALARGLSYYTGCIFEVKINNVSIGSVSGGGRYDNLTQAFGDKENLSGVGFSFGVDRIYDAMEELTIFPKDAQISSKILVCHFDDESFKFGLGILSKLRTAGIASEIYPDVSKIKKQLDFANKKLIPYTLVIGSEEISSGMMAFKNMGTGEQEKLTIDQIIEKLQQPLRS